MKKIIIAAVSENNVIGKEDKIPWHSKEELGHFKNITTGFPVIMGRKTWESLSKPLKERLNIILSRKTKIVDSHKNVLVCNSVEEAMRICEQKKYSIVFFIGGAQIYEQVISIVDEIIISKMKDKYDGDVFFPQINTTIWQLKSSENFTDFIVHTYIRK